MHYFRIMRNGTSDIVRKRNYRSRNGAGYQLLYEPNHPLTQSTGNVYEHRMVYHDEINSNPTNCEICGKEINWDNLHIDHKDDDITNNKKDNLRATCRPCNTFRGYTLTSQTDNIITIDGISKSIEGWAKMPEVEVTPAGIRKRLARGYSEYDAIYSPKRVNQYDIKIKNTGAE